MNSRDEEQVRLFRRYLIEKAGQSQSPLLRDQVRRWLERADAIVKEREESQARDESLRRAA